MQFYLAANTRCFINVPLLCRAGARPRRANLRGPRIFGLTEHPRAAYTPPLHATGPCAANTKTTPAKLRRGGVKTPPYGFTEIANKIVNTNSRQVVGAACRPPVQFDLAVNARCCVPVPAPCRAGSRPRRANLRGPRIFGLTEHPRAAYTPPLHPAETYAQIKKRVGRGVPAAGSRPRPTNPRKLYIASFRLIVGAACMPPEPPCLATNGLFLQTMPTKYGGGAGRKPQLYVPANKIAENP